MDQNALQSVFQVDQEGVNSIAKPNTTWPVSLSQTESLVVNLAAQAVVDHGDGDVPLVPSLNRESQKQLQNHCQPDHSLVSSW